MEPIEELNHSTLPVVEELSRWIVDSDCKGNIHKHYPLDRIDARYITHILEEIAVRTSVDIDELIEDPHDGSTCTILQLGAYYNCEVIVQHALNKQANFTLTTYGGTYPFLPMTALALACDNLNTSMAKLLIKYGADCNNARFRIDENGDEIGMRDCDYFRQSTDQQEEVEKFQQARNTIWTQYIRTRLNEYR